MLRDYQLPTIDVALSESATFPVRGLAVEDISRLVQRHAPALQLAFNKFLAMRSDDSLKESTLADLLSMFLSDFPDAVADVIALAADEPAQAEKVRKLPFGVQFAALEAVAVLTFTSEAEVKKTIETITRALVAVTNTVSALTADP